MNDSLDVMIRVCRQGFDGRRGVHMNETDCADLLGLFAELQGLRKLSSAVKRLVAKPKTSEAEIDAIIAGDTKKAAALSKPEFDEFNQAWDEIERLVTSVSDTVPEGAKA